jgi:hypothetical protein
MRLERSAINNRAVYEALLRKRSDGAARVTPLAGSIARSVSRVTPATSHLVSEGRVVQPVVPARSHREIHVEPLLSRMSEQADELKAVTRSAFHPGADADTAEGLLRRAQEITASLKQNEELALGLPELGADRFLRGAHEATESAAKELGSLVVSEKALQRLRARLRGAGAARAGTRLAGTRDGVSEAPATEVAGLPPSEPLTLEVASPSHGQVRVSGLARSCPARAAMIRGSAVVAAGDNCTLRSVDHYHVRRVEMPLQALLEPGSPARAALLELISRGPFCRGDQAVPGQAAAAD